MALITRTYHLTIPANVAANCPSLEVLDEPNIVGDPVTTTIRWDDVDMPSGDQNAAMASAGYKPAP